MKSLSRTIVKLEAIKRVDEILAGMTHGGSFPGSVLIAQDENILLSKGYGLADRAQEIPNSGGTRWEASASSSESCIQGDTMLKIVPLREEHLEDAALLVSKRYKRLYGQKPHLPRRYAEVNTLLPLLQNILNVTQAGVAAVRGDQLAGFLTGWQMPSFRGKRSIYSPEWANAADLEDSAHINEEMYSQMSGVWIAEKYIAHYISLFPNDLNALRAWHWMGFGMFAIDAIRGLDPVQGNVMNVDIRRAATHDLEQVMELQDALWQYMMGSPIFLISEKRHRSYYEEWLQDPGKVVWLAYMHDEPVAFMRLGPADEDVCTIISDEKTTSIYGAFTKEKVRGGGIATALLGHALKWARQSGYERCAVPFEPMNLLGTRFWLKYFTPVCFSALRIIDDRVTEIKAGR